MPIADKLPGQPDHCWLMVRNCSITPRQLGALYLSLCGVAAVVSLVFWVQGAPLVAPFAVLELVVVGGALLVYARHARDAERIVVEGAHVHIEIARGGHCTQTRWERAWVRVQRNTEAGALIALSCRGQVLHIGRFVRPELRDALARDVAAALRRP